MNRYSPAADVKATSYMAPNGDGAYYLASEVDARIAELEKDNANLRTVMIAAAEEILQHWQAHCDAEGFGPANLIRRLEMGIPSEYGYTAGAFEKLRLRNAELVKALDKAEEAMAFELGGEPLPTLMIEARAMIAALKGDAT